MKKYLRYLGPMLVCAIFVLAVYLLYHKLKAYSIAEIRDSAERISHVRILVSLLLMVVNYLILVGYDWLALKAIHKKLPLSRVCLVSFVGQAVSYNFGALLGGTSVRYRFYSSWGFTIPEIVRLVLMLAVTFWMGALGLCGLIFLVSPPVIPEELLSKMPMTDVRILGAILLSVACSYLILCCLVRHPIRIFGKELIFPTPKIAFAQALVAGLDLIAAAACMYVLLPGDMDISFISFLPSYLMAQVAVVLTHIPGGVGVFELVIIHLTQTTEAQTVFAAVLLFRLIYFILPLLAAAVLLAIYEMRVRRNMLRDAGRWLSVLSHSIAAYMTFAAGALLLARSLWPTGGMGVLPDMAKTMPASIVAAGQFMETFAGTGLLFVSYGLERRQARAFQMALSLLCLGVAGSLLYGLSWLTTCMVAVVLSAVCLARRRFYRSSFFWEEPIPAYWLVGALGCLILAFAVGWALYFPALNMGSFLKGSNADMALRVTVNFSIIAVSVILSWIWRVVRRKRAIHKLDKHI